MEQEFDFIDSSKESIADIKDYFFRVISYWKWFLVVVVTVSGCCCWWWLLIVKVVAYCS